MAAYTHELIFLLGGRVICRCGRTPVRDTARTPQEQIEAHIAEQRENPLLTPAHSSTSSQPLLYEVRVSSGGKDEIFRVLATGWNWDGETTFAVLDTGRTKVNMLGFSAPDPDCVFRAKTANVVYHRRLPDWDQPSAPRDIRDEYKLIPDAAEAIEGIRIRGLEIAARKEERAWLIAWIRERADVPGAGEVVLSCATQLEELANELEAL